MEDYIEKEGICEIKTIYVGNESDFSCSSNECNGSYQAPYLSLAKAFWETENFFLNSMNILSLNIVLLSE